SSHLARGARGASRSAGGARRVASRRSVVAPRGHQIGRRRARAREEREGLTMSCAHGLLQNETAFAIDASRIVFGAGCLDELGEHARSFGARRVALFTDRTVGKLAHVARA